MTIAKIEDSTTVEFDSYNREQITFTKEVAPDDNIPNVIEELRLLAKSCVLPRLQDLSKKQSQFKNELGLLSRKVKTKTKEWNAMAEFLRVQGIKADARNMPDFSKLLSRATEEKDTEVTEAEVIDIRF